MSRGRSTHRADQSAEFVIVEAVSRPGHWLAESTLETRKGRYRSNSREERLVLVLVLGFVLVLVFVRTLSLVLVLVADLN